MILRIVVLREDFSGANAWKRIHALAEKHQGPYRKTIIASFDAASDRIDLAALIDAIEARDVWRAAALVNSALLGSLRESVVKATRDLLELAGMVSADILNQELKGRGVLTFDIVNPRAISWIKANTGDLIKGITDGQQEVVRSIIRRVYQDGLTPTQAAREIQDHIGLLPDHQAYLEKEAARLADAGESDAAISRHLGDEADRLIEYRADMIVRTETIVAAYQGARETWRQADEEGLLPDEAVQEWIVTNDDRLCEICAPLDGLTAKLDEPFAPGIFQPGDPHPQDRCAIAMRPFGV